MKKMKWLLVVVAIFVLCVVSTGVAEWGSTKLSDVEIIAMAIEPILGDAVKVPPSELQDMKMTGMDEFIAIVSYSDRDEIMVIACGTSTAYIWMVESGDYKQSMAYSMFEEDVPCMFIFYDLNGNVEYAIYSDVVKLSTVGSIKSFDDFEKAVNTILGKPYESNSNPADDKFFQKASRVSFGASVEDVKKQYGEAELSTHELLDEEIGVLTYMLTDQELSEELISMQFSFRDNALYSYTFTGMDGFDNVKTYLTNVYGTPRQTDAANLKTNRSNSNGEYYVWKSNGLFIKCTNQFGVWILEYENEDT